MIETQPAGGKITLLLSESLAGVVLRAEGERNVRKLDLCGSNFCGPDDQYQAPSSNTFSWSSSTLTLRRVRLAIAGRVFDAVGASLVFCDSDPAGFVLRIPH